MSHIHEAAYGIFPAALALSLGIAAGVAVYIAAEALRRRRARRECSTLYAKLRK